MKNRCLLFLSVLWLGMSVQAAFVGDPAPSFTLKDRKGQDVSLIDFQGKAVLVNFWASWCPPCKQEFPELNALADEYKDKEFRVVAINLDKKADHVEKFLTKAKTDPEEMIILLDPKSEVVSRYIARSMPSSFIIDKAGVIRFVHFGYSDKDPRKWREEISSLLQENANTLQ